MGVRLLDHEKQKRLGECWEQKGATLSVNIVTDPRAIDFIDAHADTLSSSFTQVQMSERMRARLERSTWIFSGMKAIREMGEAFPSLLDENGERKPFERFLNDVRKVDQTYNQHYLRAEYEFAAASAQMAAKWERFAEDGDRYNLQYRTAGDDRVRPEHAALDGITLPPSDSFWESYFPPNGWRCRCDVVQVRKSKYPVTPHDEAMQLGEMATAADTKNIFRFNPGKQQRVFPAANPYTSSKCNGCELGAQETLAKGEIPTSTLCQGCRLLHECEDLRYDILTEYPNGGKILKHQLVDSKDSDYNKLIIIAQFFASQGKEVRLTPKVSRPKTFIYENIYHSLIGTKYEGTCPDFLIDGVWYEHEGFITLNGKRAFGNMMNHGLKQASRLIIDDPKLTDAFMKRSVWNRIKNGQIIDEVWILDGTNFRKLYKKSEE